MIKNCKYNILTTLFLGTVLQLPAFSAAEDLDILDLPITTIQKHFESGKLTSRSLVESYLKRIAAYDQKGPKLNSISTINDNALNRADELDRERKTQGPRSPLHGIPILVKDNYGTADMQTAAGSSVFEGWIPAHDSTIVKRLREAGAIILGKTTMHEFAMGYANHGSLFGQTLNPYALDRIPGGSSGGTGAAVAANFATAGFGSDTCGSIRMPSSHNALVGLRSSVGLSSRHGIIPLAHSWDTGGPMTHNVTDLAIIYDVIAGYDAADPQTANSAGHIPGSYTSNLRRDGLSGQRLGLLTNLLLVDEKDKEVASIIRRAVEDIKKAGAKVVDINVPGLMELMQDDTGGFYPILLELRPDMNAYLKANPGIGVESVAGIINSESLKDDEIRGFFQLAIKAEPGETFEYLAIQAKRQRIRQAVVVAMAEAGVDALVYPTIRQKPAKIGETQSGTNCHLSGNIDFPAISVPAGFTDDGLPVGIEFMARKWQEAYLLRLAYAYEQASLHRRMPASTPAL